MVELGVTRARMLAPRADGDAEMFVTISGGFAGDPGPLPPGGRAGVPQARQAR